MNPFLSSILRFPPSVLAAVGLLLSAGCGDTRPVPEGRVVIRYWEKWTGFEADAMREVVDEFNASQDRIHVDYSSVSQIDRRLMLAIAGGVPPDVAGIWGHVLPVYAENNALEPLDAMAARHGLDRDDYIGVYWDICRYRGHLWGLPSTPASIALVWNKRLFREAGLDPDQPPRSLAELEAFNERIIQRDDTGRITRFGHLPAEPGWWNSLWGYWFGAELWDGDTTITVDSPANIAAYQWVASYPERFGVRDLMSFRDGFGNFASPQNPFFSGRVAMVLQGPWIYNFIDQYAPEDFEWGVAPFPAADPDALQDVCIVETDVMVIPAGAEHPEEAFEFIRYVQSQSAMETLCLGQRKFSPLKETSETFFERHPNPHIGEFLRLARSPNARHVPQTTVWSIFSNDMNQAFQRIWTGSARVEEALGDVREHVQEEFDHRHRRWLRMRDTLRKEWSTP